MSNLVSNTLKQEIHRKIFYCSLILIAITLPYSLLANSISIIILTLNWIVEGNYSGKIKAIKNNRFFLFFILFYVLHLVGMIYTNNSNNGLFELQKKLPLFVLPVILASSQKLSEKQIKSILAFFLLSILAASFICFGNALYRNAMDPSPTTDWLYFSYKDLTEIIKIQPTYLAIYVCFSIFILCYLLIDGYSSFRSIKKIISYLLILFLIVFLFLIASRTAIAAFVVISFLTIIYYYYKAKMLMKGFVVLGVAGLFFIAIVLLIPVSKERLFQALGVEHQNVWINQYGNGTGTIKDVRPLKWQCAFNVIRENWLFGVGTGDVQDELQIQYKKIDFMDAYLQEFNAHNQFLETWIGVGFAGLISFFLCLILPTITSFSQKKYLYLSFLILFVVSCLTESILCRQQGVVFYALFNSMFAFHFIDKN